MLRFGESIAAESRHPAVCKRIGGIGNLLGQTIGLTGDELFALFCGCHLFEIGKVAIPERIWRKPGLLSAAEFALIQSHTTIGFEMCRRIAPFRASLPIIRNHHERWDGSGYPDQLSGEAIPLLARLFQIADLYDMLTSERVYRRASTRQEAIGAMMTVPIDPGLLRTLAGLSGPALSQAASFFPSVSELFYSATNGHVTQGTDLYSCFISHSSEDATVVNKLNDDLNAAHIRSWYAPRDLRAGDALRPKIDRTIRLHDRLLLILSASSIASPWVESEVEAALEEERSRGELPEELRGNPTVVFPIRIDDSVFSVHSGWPAFIRRTRHIADFTSWQDPASYRNALACLIRALTISDEVDAKARAARRQAAADLVGSS
jgi:hypothetical protein